MPPSKQNISTITIENEIYNTFEQFKTEKNIKIANFLNKLDTNSFIKINYRKIKFPCETLFKLLLYKELKGIKYHSQTQQYLKDHPEEAQKLALDTIPNRRTIGLFQNHILNPETRELLKFTTDKIKEISEKFGILLDIQTLEPEITKKQTKKRNQRLQKFKKRFAPFINFNLNHNTIYTKNQFIDLMIHMGMTRDFAENGYKTFNELRTIACPNADTLLYHLKNYNNDKGLHKMFTTLFEIIWEMIRQTNTIDQRKKYDVAIDFTEWFYYGDRSTPMIVGKKPERGTTKCYKFATINIVETGKRFTLLALPMGPFNQKEQILQQLLSYAQQRIRINRVYVDRGFFDSHSIKIFNKFHLKYLMPCTQYIPIKNTLEIIPAPTVITDFKMADINFTMVIVNDEDGNKRAFATNEVFDEQDVNLAERLFLLYGKRWGIEIV